MRGSLGWWSLEHDPVLSNGKSGSDPALAFDLTSIFNPAGNPIRSDSALFCFGFACTS
jgi:hypothetical protein